LAGLGFPGPAFFVRELLINQALEQSALECEQGAMEVTVHIPDELANRLGDNLSRRALEAFAAEEYKHDRITKRELQSLLGIETSFQLDEFLKAHDVWIEYTSEDAVRERKGLERLGF
jgi:Uncharacterised protein family (UPF0175)